MPDPEINTGDPELDQEIKNDLKELGDTDNKPEPKPEKTDGEEKDAPPAGEEKPKPAPEPKPEKPKEPAQVPAWKLRIADKRAGKPADAPKPEPKPEAKPDAEAPRIDPGLESLAKEIGADPEVLVKLDAYFKGKYGAQQLPPEVQELLKDAPKLREARERIEAQDAETEYRREFEATVKPLVVKEYPDASAELLESISQQLRQKLDDPNLTFTPLKTIYRGEDDFRGLAAPKKKSAEEKGGGGSGRDTQLIDFEDVTPEHFEAMDDEMQEKYVAWQVEQEQKKKR